MRPDSRADRRGDQGEIQRQARALADPTRHEIFRRIALAAGPVGVAELTDAFGLHHTAVRQHLAKLREAGLVVESVQARTGPGRPRLGYRISPEAAGGWGTEGPYRRLSDLLAETVSSHRSARAVGRDAGRAEARRMVAADGSLAAFVEELAREGFRPRREATGPEAAVVELALERCPFEEVAAASPAVVCALHQGLAEGLAEGLGSLTVTALRPSDPHAAGCRLSVRVDSGAGPVRPDASPNSRRSTS